MSIQTARAKMNEAFARWRKMQDAETMEELRKWIQKVDELRRCNDGI